MKEYLKVYGVTVLVSAVIVLVPWVLDWLGIATGIDVLEWQGILFGVFALIFSVIYVLRKVKTWKPRVLLILLNPAIYYIIVLMYIGITFTYGPWTRLN
ncbi:MAG: hypothetical protein IKT67_03755 [Lachnospiraceae bacterium]|nr:hypothetical protein [Lachnospiraceae bacterium]